MIRLVTINGMIYAKYPHYQRLVGPAGADEQREEILMPIQAIKY